MQPSLSKFIKITLCSRATKLVNFQIISTLSNESWNKILPSLSQAFTTHHPYAFTPILSSSEGRAGIAWVPSNKMLFFPLRYKAPLAFPQMFSLYFYSYTILSDSGFKGLKRREWRWERSGIYCLPVLFKQTDVSEVLTTSVIKAITLYRHLPGRLKKTMRTLKVVGFLTGIWTQKLPKTELKL
jgi:hypothetical protein